MKKDRRNLIVVCGPTASGKTRLAVAAAMHIGGEIISADSRQVYRGMDIGTGKDLVEYTTPSGTVPYHLIDVADPEDVYTLYHFQRDCYRCIHEIGVRKKTPFLAGGSGLYIEAVLKHYRIPNVPEDPLLRKLLMKKTREALLHQLKSLDEALFTTTDKTSKKRLARSVEVALYAKDHTVQWGVPHPPMLSPLILGVTWPRKVLLERIDKRLHERLEAGMVEEVESLLQSGVTAERLELMGMEYKHIVRYLQGTVAYSTMVTGLCHDIHRLAKRQTTYFRGFERRGLEVTWIENPDAEKVIEILDRYQFS